MPFVTLAEIRSKLLPNVALKLEESNDDFIRIERDAAEIISELSGLAIPTSVNDAPEWGQLLPEIENAIFAMQPNQVSEPMAVDLGIYIFKLIEKTPAKKASLNEVKTQISNILLEQKFRKQLSEWVAKLKKEAYVEIKK